MMVLDECDLLLSFGHEKDIKYVFERCREGVQTVMVLVFVHYAKKLGTFEIVVVIETSRGGLR